MKNPATGIETPVHRAPFLFRMPGHIFVFALTSVLAFLLYPAPGLPLLTQVAYACGYAIAANTLAAFVVAWNRAWWRYVPLSGLGLLLVSTAADLLV